jgi:thiamine biosynthesis protein ThiS
MQILIVNGTEQQYPTGRLPSTLADLLRELNISSATVAAEIDDQIIEHDKFGETKLYSGQKIELIRFVGGG